jgi:hypothetical protein
MLFFASGVTVRTFVLSKETNGGYLRRSGIFGPQFETFHEIIYGKPTRCKRAAGFFLPLPELCIKAIHIFARCNPKMRTCSPLTFSPT